MAELGHPVDLVSRGTHPWRNSPLRNWQEPLGCLLPHIRTWLCRYACSFRIITDGNATCIYWSVRCRCLPHGSYQYRWRRSVVHGRGWRGRCRYCARWPTNRRCRCRDVSCWHVLWWALRRNRRSVTRQIQYQRNHYLVDAQLHRWHLLELFDLQLNVVLA